jgi:hypothetical protein
LKAVLCDLLTLYFCESTTERWMIGDFRSLEILTEGPRRAIPKTQGKKQSNC